MIFAWYPHQSTARILQIAREKLAEQQEATKQEEQLEEERAKERWASRGCWLPLVLRFFKRVLKWLHFEPKMEIHATNYQDNCVGFQRVYGFVQKWGWPILLAIK